MITAMHKLTRLGLGFLLLLALMVLGLPSSGWAAGSQLKQRLQALSTDNVTAQALLLMQDKRDSARLNDATFLLEKQLGAQPDDRTVRMFYGYGQLFQAGDYLRKKNYMRAAELSKLGFYALDEAAETEPENWRLFWLRARMDAFVPASNGRCVVAIKDVNTLNDAVPASLKPMLTLMRARAAESCNDGDMAALAWKTLHEMDADGEALLENNAGTAPAWTSEEIDEVILPLMEGKG